MKSLSFKFTFFSCTVLGLFFTAMAAYAFCPVCTLVVGAGVECSRWLGIDDTITGVWIGAFVVSLIAWTIAWLDKKKIRFYGRKILTILFYYVMIIWPLYHWQIMGKAGNKLWSLDKLLLGMIVGTIAFFIAMLFYQHLKKKNNGRAHFLGEKIVLPVGTLLVLSAIFYFLTKC